MRARLHNAIFLAMALGAVLGLWLSGVSPHAAPWRSSVLQGLDFVGKELFIGALKMIIAPLILVSIVAGVTSIPSWKDAGRIGGRTLIYYAATTALAVSLGLALVLIIAPGERGRAPELRAERVREIDRQRENFVRETGKELPAPGSALEPEDEAGRRLAQNQGEFLNYLAEREGVERSANDARYSRVAAKRERGHFEMFVEDIVRPLMMNPFRSLAETNSLGIIAWALLLGLALLAVGPAARPLVDVFQAANSAVLKLTVWIMSLSPIAVFCLMASILAAHGPQVLETLAWYCATVIGGIFIHIGVLLLIVRVAGGMPVRRFLSGIREAWAIAFATRSSAATLPVTIRCVQQNLGVSPKVANFTLPVGATVNMDGTALYEGVAVVFLLQLFGGMEDVGIQIGGMVTLLIFVTAVLASVGAAAVPDAGLVTMVLVAGAVHLPVYYLPFIFAVDAFLDMFRTSTNVLGDAVGAVVVDRFERRSDADPPAARGC